MSIRFLFLLCSITLSLTQDESFQEENGVIIVTSDNLDKIRSKYNSVLLLFYVPWCKHSKKFIPEFEKAASVLKNEGIHLAKVDASKQKSLSSRFEVQAYPTALYLNPGETIEYTGYRESIDIINWIRRQTGKTVYEFSNKEEVERFKDENKISLIYFGNDKQKMEEYRKVAGYLEEYVFGHVRSRSLIGEFTNKSEVLVLYKNFDELNNTLFDVKEEKIIDFLQRFAYPKVMSLNEREEDLIFGFNKPALFLFAKKSSQNFDGFRVLLEQISEEVRKEDKIKLVLSDITDDSALKLAEFLQISDGDLPCVRIVDTRKRTKKYRMGGEINKENVWGFIKNWQNNKLKEYFRSQSLAKADTKSLIKVYVGENFNEEVMNNKNDFIVFFYTSWCSKCGEYFNFFENIAKRFVNTKNLIFAKVDAENNEILHETFTQFPSIRFYPGRKKDLPSIEYEGSLNDKEFIVFIKRLATVEVMPLIEAGDYDKSQGKKGGEMEGEESINKSKSTEKIDADL